MAEAFFILGTVLLLSGVFLVRLGFRRFGALFIGGAFWLFLWRFSWRPLEFLAGVVPALAPWTDPSRAHVQAGFNALFATFAAALAALVGLRGGSGRREGGDPGWETPGEFRGLEAALGAVLRRPGAAQGTFLGMAVGGRKVFLSDRAREGHMQVVGPTRSGKSQFLLSLAAQDMVRGMPVFFMEAKGDRGDFDQYLKLSKRADRLPEVRYFNPQDGERSMSFNPIRPVPGQDATAVANQIARAIGREPTSSGEGQDYYRSVDYAKIQAMAEVFCATGRQFTLRDCFYYFSFAEARSVVFELCPDKGLVALALSGLQQNPESSALTSALRPWTTGPLGDLLNDYDPGIKLETVFEHRQLAYFAVPIGHLQVLANPLGRMVIAGLLSVAASRQKQLKKPGPASIILDEFAEFATPAFTSFIATVGSARLRTVLSHQDMGQLDRIQGMDTGAFRSAVYNNSSGCKVCFRSPDPEDAEFWALTLGTFSTLRDTERVTRSILADHETGERSRRAVEEFKVHPNKLKNLEPGTALVFAPGEHACLVRTARVHRILGGLPVPELGAAQGGLDLAAAVADPENAKPAGPNGEILSMRGGRSHRIPKDIQI